MIELPALFDAHGHFRDKDLLQFTVPQTARYCECALAMPNLDPPIITGEQAEEYRGRINAHAPNLKILTTISLTKDVTPEALSIIKGIAGVKLYPDGVTFNSNNNGYTAQDLCHGNVMLNQCLDVLEKRNIPLLVHGEMPGVFVMYRELEFLYVMRDWLLSFPKLRIVLEHVSTKEGIEFVGKFAPRCAGTITLHHMMLTLDDIIGDKMCPHLFFKPIVKTPNDREAIILAATSGEKCYFLGSDSAPHDVITKICARVCPGVFTAPCLVEMLVEQFAKHGKLASLANFASNNGREFYGLPKASWQLEVGEEKRDVPRMVGPFVPFRDGETLNYSMR